MAKPILTAARLRELFHYCPETGVFTRLVTRAKNAQAGSIAGTIDTIGYRRISIGPGYFYGHRLAWLYVHGEWPVGSIDHIDGDRANNSIKNLRPCDQSQNNQNRVKVTRYASKGRGVKTASSYLGVTWGKGRKSWRAQIIVGGKYFGLGHFKTEEEAAAAYAAAKARLHSFNPTVR